MSRQKRKKLTVTMHMRLQALERIEKGEVTVKDVCYELGVGKSTISDWRRKKHMMQDYITRIDSEETLLTRCTLKKPKNQIVDDALWVWYQQEQRKGRFVNGPILKEKALLINTKIGNDRGFTASEGWLMRWKKRHGVRFLESMDRAPAHPLDGLDVTDSSWFQSIMESERLRPEQVYFIGETILNFKTLPGKMSVLEDSNSACNVNERVTIGICTNAAGTHKMPLVVIGSPRTPRSLKNVYVTSLPVYYRAQKSAWMDSHLFKEWFAEEFVPRVRDYLTCIGMPVKAKLVVDNDPTLILDLSPEDGEGVNHEIRTMFLPPNMPEYVLPIDHGVVECLKLKFRRKLLSEMLSRLDDDACLLDVVETINTKDVIYMLATAFEEIAATTFIRSWSKLWPDIGHYVENSCSTSEESDTDENDTMAILNCCKHLPGGEALDVQDVFDWINNSDRLPKESMTVEEIISAVKAEEDDIASAEDIKEEQISHTDGKRALELALRYIEQQAASTPSDLLTLRKWRDLASRKIVMMKENIDVE